MRNIVLERAFAFAIDVTETARKLRDQKEYDLASQFWRSGTSIGANIEEAQAAQSRADFRSKMSIAAKEARECDYWLRLALATKALPRECIMPLLESLSEIRKLLTSIVKSAV